jgi:hypothetical protein
MATSGSGSPNDGRGADLAIFSGIWTHSSCRLRLSVSEHSRAVGLDVLVEPFGHDRCERGLADLERVTPQVVAVQLDEVDRTGRE